MSNFKVIVPRVDDNKFKTMLEPSLKRIGVNALQVFDKDQNIQESIFKKMNAGIQAAVENDLTDDDVVIFAHEDVSFVDQLFKEKIELLFSEKPDVRLLGVTGSTEITERGGWWMNAPNKLRGGLLQGKNNGSMNEAFHLIKGPIGYFDDVVAVDGCMMITKGDILRRGLRFDEATYEGNDFYDLDMCFQVLDQGYKIAVADILIFHQSSGLGVFNDSWKNAKEKFFEKWSNKGYILPFTKDQFKERDPKEDIDIVEIDL